MALTFEDFENVPPPKVKTTNNARPLPKEAFKDPIEDIAKKIPIAKDAPTGNVPSAQGKTKSVTGTATDTKHTVSKTRPATITVDTDAAEQASQFMQNADFSQLQNLEDPDPDAENLYNPTYEDDSEDYDEDEGVPDPIDPENLPVRKTPITNLTDRNPLEWFTIEQLPGYAQKEIRILGNLIFKEYTNTPLKNIKILATLTNRMNDLERVAATLKKRGRKIMDVQYDFEQTIPDYKVELATLYRYNDNDYLVMKDFAGYYIYSWPSNQSKLPAGMNRAQLEAFFNKNTALRESFKACLLKAYSTKPKRTAMETLKSFLEKYKK